MLSFLFSKPSNLVNAASLLSENMWFSKSALTLSLKTAQLQDFNKFVIDFTTIPLAD